MISRGSLAGARILALAASAILLAGGALFAANSAHAQSKPAAMTQGAPGADVCAGCHEDQVNTFRAAKHGVRGDSRTPASAGGCATCHGDGTEHVKANGGRGVGGIKNPGPKSTSMTAQEKSDLCMTCHKGKSRNYWSGSTHPNNDIACSNCHQMHAPTDNVLARKTQTQVCFTCHREQRADSHKISTHPIQAGKVVCSDCHNPHGSPGPSMVKKNSVVETCWTCHAEKRGPFLFEHQPVVENCTYCHAPHGSNLSPMMISRSPFLCQSCHDGPHASETPAGRNAAGVQGGFSASSSLSANVTGRGCLNCHSVIHGSNSPTGGYFQR